ncbi:class II myosin [Ophidiomyces ophidiicola]|nr:class II myosin [Ophidiomyces ophidiicola]
MNPSSISVAQRRSPFSRDSVSPSPAPRETTAMRTARPKSVTFASPAPVHNTSHARTPSFNPPGSNSLVNPISRQRSNSFRNNNTPSSGTFAPQFIKSEELRKGADEIRGQEGDNDFSGKRYVWLKDSEKAFIRGLIVEESEGVLLVQCDDGSRREISVDNVDKVNPAKFDKADDMAELTHLNEASVVHNLHSRYQSDLIYVWTFISTPKHSLLTTGADILRTVLGDREPVLPVANILQRVHQII